MTALVQYYAIRSSGVVVMVLYTLTVVLGLLNVSRVNSETWPRFVIDRVHRSASLLALVFLIIHILVTITDSFVSTPLAAVIIPFAHSYSTFWIGLGAAASDLMLAVTVTSLLRARVGHRLWRAVHWSAYAAWPLAMIHGIGAGTDTSAMWMLALDVICIGAVLCAVAFRAIAVPRLEAV
jgi:sulfoxide reductase heme-binding subunit YedZ